MQKKEDVVRIQVECIYPDPDQPRKRLPKDLAVAVKKGMGAQAFLQELRQRAELQPGLGSFLKGLDDLATSIQQVGQITPIRVYMDEENCYVIDVGERRWLAHLILYAERGESGFSDIDAIVVSKQSASTEQRQTLQRRMAENVHRAEFSPTEMARGLTDRIAQILKTNPKMKRSQAEEIVGEENGITGRRVRQYLSLLGLCEEAIALAQEGGLTERALRGVLKHKEPTAQVTAIRKLILGQTDRLKASRTPANPGFQGIHEWAESFMQSVLVIGHDKTRRKLYERALQLRLKRNPRARALLNRLLQSNRHVKWNVKHDITGISCANSARHRNGGRQKNNDDHIGTARPHEHARRGAFRRRR